MKSSMLLNVQQEEQKDDYICIIDRVLHNAFPHPTQSNELHCINTRPLNLIQWTSRWVSFSPTTNFHIILKVIKKFKKGKSLLPLRVVKSVATLNNSAVALSLKKVINPFLTLNMQVITQDEVIICCTWGNLSLYLLTISC